ncbi:MAG: hypothetical protein AVDCRST_MAG93-8116 [uncultured Chloroflexia bacterium]|uniref:Uncharacterized protein n=1 Tax=uncultured Chloroflexia bacterium TaxID=1672391 RepID=A0A6J4MST9_9CHLR|nr:MAG: hypothetical protein AVDCRST_MAG93-8116 [uncultured Chloroflexia bacterium]
MTADALGALALLVLMLLISGALAPLETLGWWAGWFGVAPEQQPVTPAVTPADTTTRTPAGHYLIFLSGIDSVSGESYAPREMQFVKRLHAELPDTEIIELFPYSVTNRALTGQRLFARVWRWVLARRLSGESLVGALINARNVWQVIVSADKRYGPMYNEGSAELILAGLARSSYQLGSGTPVTILGYSGGGQIAAGAAPQVKSVLQAPLVVISLAGVLSSDPGLSSIEHLYHLYGERDHVQRIGHIIFPGRWRITRNSSWNQAVAAGKITFMSMGPMKHTGAGGYFDAACKLPDGTDFLTATATRIASLVTSGQSQVAGNKATRVLSDAL